MSAISPTVRAPPDSRAGSRVRRRLRAALREPWLLALVGATGVLDAVASLIRHAHFQSGLDLAIFDQVVWHYSRFEAPFSSIKAENILGDHFHPLVAVLAPLYWIWSDPRMLLIAQALLVAASIVPVFLFAWRRLGRACAYLLACAYAVYWGLQVGVLYDFHEIAFAPLLIALAILLADLRRWPWFWLVIVLLLGVKEDLSIFVAVFGVYLLTRKEYRHGVALIVVGIAWYELATHVFIPHFAAQHSGYKYWTYGELGNNPLSAVWALVKGPWRVFTIGLSPWVKARTVLALFGPFLFFTFAAPRMLLLALPLLAERFLSTNSNFWYTHYDYSMSIAPVLAMGAAAGLGNIANALGVRRRRAVILIAASGMLVASIAISKFATTDSVVSKLTSAQFYHAPSYAGGASRALARVPAGASLATQDFVLPHASDRSRIEQLDPVTVGRDRYILANVRDPSCCGVSGDGTTSVFGRVLDRELPMVTPVYYDSGWLLARRAPAGQRPGNGVLVPMPAASATAVQALALHWKLAALSALQRFFPCWRRVLAHTPGAAACFAATNGALERDAGSLTGAIAAVQPSLTGGCAELARAATAAVNRLTRDFTSLAGLPQTVSSFDTSGRELSTDITGLDLPGQVDRMTILCSPRA